MFTPLIKFRGTTIAKAFIINALIMGIVAALTVETRRILNKVEFNTILPDRINKLAATMAISTGVGFITLIIMRFIFGTYGGTLDGKRLSYFL